MNQWNRAYQHPPGQAFQRQAQKGGGQTFIQTTMTRATPSGWVTTESQRRGGRGPPQNPMARAYQPGWTDTSQLRSDRGLLPMEGKAGGLFQMGNQHTPMQRRCWYGTGCWGKNRNCPYQHEESQQGKGTGGKGQKWDTHQGKAGKGVGLDQRPVAGAGVCEPVPRRQTRFALSHRERPATGVSTSHGSFLSPATFLRRTSGAAAEPNQGRGWEKDSNYWKPLSSNSQWRNSAPGRKDSRSAQKGVYY